ncbi:STAM-binding protein-like [Branchiostoma lanceolatum]|uniref:STAM-binding protein-like n=1 Tax=Branchiostoma lanceolatum TaxID=7740 RepID=UPI003452C5A7
MPLSVPPSPGQPSERVRVLSEKAATVTVEDSIAPRMYFRSGVEMVRMATVYHEEGNLEAAFILYMKFITLFVEKLPKHPEYKSAPAKDKQTTKRKLEMVFPVAEKCKKKLTEKYTDDLKEWEIEKQKIEEQIAIERAKEAERQRQIEEDRRMAESLMEEEKEEIRKESQEEQYRRMQEQKRLELEREKDRTLEEKAVPPTVLPLDGVVPFSKPQSWDDTKGGVITTTILGPDTAKLGPAAANVSTLPGQVNGQVQPEQVQPVVPSAPPPAYSPPGGLPPPKYVPTVDRSTKPASLHDVPSSNKYGLRQVVVPQEIMLKFLNLAQPNTVKNIETCGILAGKLKQNSFTITHVLVPKQSGTPDSCTTLSEEELFDYQDKHELITLGWIHTHPTQTAFLSSVDLHTHCSYQLMMPEAIAIVCSPKHQQTGVFMLTPNHGLNFVASCRQKGFHPHPKEPPLFEDCSHVKMLTTETVVMVDLRK